MTENSAEIVLEQTEDALSVPVEAVSRGNLVMVTYAGRDQNSA